MTASDLAGRDILITGHTGFKGAWLSLWLTRLGARVHGIALDPLPGSLFERADVSPLLASDRRIDIRDLGDLEAAISEVSPDAVMHLAAQPLVRDSYLHPIDTFSTNVMGTVNTLAATMSTPSVKAVLIVTTDKVYRNIEQAAAYREGDALGGNDPYSASKACAEIATHALSSSHTTSDIRVTTARSGNVLGGGDIAKDRLLPDLIRSFSRRDPAVLRYPNAVRPWQHVLDPLNGYIKIVQHQLSGEAIPPLNLGSDPADGLTVRQVAETAALEWGGRPEIIVDADTDHPHEAGLLLLDSALAHSKIGWEPLLSSREAVNWTVAWHRDVDKGMPAFEATTENLDTFEKLMGAHS
jgi:CDP-glucose 4,6-dehydratase